MKKYLIVAVIITISMMVSGVSFGNACTPNAPTCCQNQSQGQTQVQAQGQQQYQSVIVNGGGQSESVNTPVDIPTVYPQSVPLISSTFGAYPLLPRFAHKALQPLDIKNDIVVGHIKTYNGGVFTSERLEDVVQDLLSMANEILQSAPGKEDKIRLQVLYKGASTGISIGGGGSGGIVDGMTSGAVAVLPGVAGSTFNPKFIYIWVLIQ